MPQSRSVVLPLLGLKIHFLFGCHCDTESTVVAHFQDALRSCPGTQCPGLRLQRFSQQVPLLLQRPWELVSPEMLRSKEDPVRAELWLFVIIFSHSILLLYSTFLCRNLPLSSLPYLTTCFTPASSSTMILSTMRVPKEFCTAPGTEDSPQMFK